MKHSVSHDLDPETARKVAKKALEGYAAQFAQYNPTLHWRNDDAAEFSFSAKGLTVKGQLDLRPGAIDIDINVPFALKLFQKKAISVVDDEIREWVGKAKRGEL